MLRYLKAGTVKRIHVDRRVMRANLQDGTNKPALTVQTSKGPMKARRVTVLGYSEMEQAGPEYSEVDGRLIRTINPLSCGARAWLRTTAAVEVIS